MEIVEPRNSEQYVRCMLDKYRKAIGQFIHVVGDLDIPMNTPIHREIVGLLQDAKYVLLDGYKHCLTLSFGINITSTNGRKTIYNQCLNWRTFPLDCKIVSDKDDTVLMLKQFVNDVINNDKFKEYNINIDRL